MAKFCRNCGQPLEDGMCPYCDIPFETPEYSDTDYDYSESGYGHFGESAFAGFGGVFRSGNILKIIPFIGYAAQAVISVFRFLFNLSGSGIDYDIHMTLLMINLIAGIVIAADAVSFFRGDKKNALSLIKAGVAAVMGLFSLVFILALLMDFPYTIDPSYGAYFILLAGLWVYETNTGRRQIYLVGLIASALNFFFPLFSGIGTYWISSLLLLIVHLCIAFAYAFDNND